MSRNWYLTATKVGLVGLLSLTVSVAQAAPRADHTTVDASSIPQTALDNARALHMSFSHASVGGNIWEGLSVLTTQSSSRYAFPNWTDDSRGNPGWQAKVDDFETYVAANLSGTSVFLNKFCYIDQDASFSYYRDSMVKLAGLYPSKTFVWFTMPIMTSDPDNSLRQAFNTQVRTYTTQNNLPLFDLADIESHKADGTPVTDGGKETMASEWSLDGGHLNESGSVRAASAMWWLMAQLGGWTNGTGGAGGQGGAGGSGGSVASSGGSAATTGGSGGSTSSGGSTAGTGGTGGQVDAGASGGSQADAAVTGGSVASSGGSVAATGGSGGGTSSGGSIAGTGGTGGQVDAGASGGSQADAAVTGGNRVDAAVTGGNQIDAAITGGNVVGAGGNTATTGGTGGITASATGGTVVGAGGSVTAANGGETAGTGGGGAGGTTTAGGTPGDTGGAYGIGDNVAAGGNTAATIGPSLPGTGGATRGGGSGGAIASAATSPRAASGGTAATGGSQPKSTGIAKSTNGDSSGCSCSLSGATTKRDTAFFGLFAIVCVLVAARRRRL